MQVETQFNQRSKHYAFQHLEASKLCSSTVYKEEYIFTFNAGTKMSHNPQISSIHISKYTEDLENKAHASFSLHYKKTGERETDLCHSQHEVFKMKILTASDAPI